MLKKWLTLMLCLAMALSVLPLEAFAEPTDPTTETTETTTEQPTTEQPTPPAEETEAPKPKLEPLSPAQAATPTNKLPTKNARIQRLRYLIQWDYQCALEQEDRESLYGFCGLLASYQMYYRGINTWRLCYDGKDNYDAFAKMGMTDGGYTIRSYSAFKQTQEPAPETPSQDAQAPTEPVPEEAPTEAQPATETTTAPQTQETPAAPEVTAPEEPQEPEKYTIAEILNRVTNNSSKEVYNLLVCFDRTDTAAGSVYGHVLFVYGIIDGTVYFTEGGNMFGVEAGEPMEVSIDRFSASYATWTDFEGVIVFGNKDYLDNCIIRTSSMFATCTQSVPLLPLPDQIENGTVLRTAAKGERLQVVALYQNRDGEYYYEIYDDGKICYAPATGMESLLFLHEPYETDGLVPPQTLEPGKDLRLDGKVKTANYISQIRVSVVDAQGETLQRYTEAVNDSQYDLDDWELNKLLDFATLPEGYYTLKVEAVSCNWYLYHGYLAKNLRPETVVEQIFTVGENVTVPVVAKEAPVMPVKDGWVYENMTWYCYDQGTPVTGWKQDQGAWYYLQADGSVSTGWTLADGQLRLFTGTGAMRTGWVSTKMGRQYLLANGNAAHGWLQVDGSYYYFNELGILQDNHMRNTMTQMAQLDKALYGTEQVEE